jgi:hypothetical protein
LRGGRIDPRERLFRFFLGDLLFDKMFWKGHVGGLWSVLRRIEICLHVGTLGMRERIDDGCVVLAF